MYSITVSPSASGLRRHPSIHSFNHSAVCLTTGSQPLPEPVLHTVRSSASSFNSPYSLVSLGSSSSSLRFIPRLTVTLILPLSSLQNVFQKAVPIWLAFHVFFYHLQGIIILLLDFMQYFFISHTFGPTDLLRPSPAPHLETLAPLFP